MASAIEIIIATLLVLAVPFILGLVWVVRRSQLRRRAELELKKGNKVFNEWRQTGTSQRLDEDLS